MSWLLPVHLKLTFFSVQLDLSVFDMAQTCLPSCVSKFNVSYMLMYALCSRLLAAWQAYLVFFPVAQWGAHKPTCHNHCDRTTYFMCYYIYYFRCHLFTLTLCCRGVDDSWIYLWQIYSVLIYLFPHHALYRFTSYLPDNICPPYLFFLLHSSTCSHHLPTIV